MVNLLCKAINTDYYDPFIPGLENFFTSAGWPRRGRCPSGTRVDSRSRSQLFLVAYNWRNERRNMFEDIFTKTLGCIWWILCSKAMLIKAMKGFLMLHSFLNELTLNKSGVAGSIEKKQELNPRRTNSANHKTSPQLSWWVTKADPQSDERTASGREFFFNLQNASSRSLILMTYGNWMESRQADE